LANGINFNPALNFDQGNTEQMPGGGGFHTVAYYIVARPDNTLNDASTNEVMVGFDAPAGATNEFGGLILGSATSAFAGEIITHAIGGSGTRWRRGITNASFGDVIASTTYLFAVRDNAGATTSELFVDGLEQANLNSGTFLTSSNEPYEIGSYTAANAFDNDGHFDGQIAEVISFSVRPSDGEHNRIESYLAIKYGITLDNSGGGATGDLLNSSGTVIWDASINATYHNRVTAIGRDDNSDLDQRQSASSDASKLLTIGLGDVAATNAANGNSFSANNSFFATGDDDGTISFSATGAPSGYEILGRTWKVEEAGTVGDVAVQIPDNTSSETIKLPALTSDKMLVVLVDSDENFSDGAVAYAMELNGTNWVANVDFTSGEFFTFAEKGAVLEVTTEGNEAGPINIVYTLSLPGINTSGSAITFDFDDLGTGTATSGVDYTAIAGAAQISVADGVSAGTISVVVADDVDSESAETVIATVSNPSSSSVQIEQNTATAIIIDNDGAPGDVSGNLVFWLKANAGTNSTTDGAAITDWEDQTNNANDASDFSTNDPTYEDLLSNFNPALNFTGSADRGFSLSNDGEINTSSSTAKSYSIVIRTSTDISTRQFIYEEGGAGTGLNLYIEGGSLHANLWSGNSEFDGSTVINTSTDYLVTFIYDGGSSEWNMYVNGALTTSQTSVLSSLNAHSGGIGLGILNGATQVPADQTVNGSNAGFDGYIMEMAYYNTTAHSTAERNRIESYLALKYSIDLDQDLIASDGITNIWSEATNLGYTNQVTGIGLDGPSIFNQKQSISTDEEGMVSIGLGSLEVDNASNTNNFVSDLSFLAWGNDGGTLSYSPTGAPDQLNILGRVWKVQETGTVGSVKISVPGSTSSATVKLPLSTTVFLLVDADGDFSSGATTTEMTLNGTEWEADADFSNGDYFSFAIGGAVLSATAVGVENTADIVFTVTLPDNNTTGSAVTFDFDDAGTGSATSGSDYTAISGSAQISVANGSNTGSITVTVLDDGIIELTETVNTIISNSSSALFPIVGATATGSIEDDDALGPGGVSTDIEGWYKANLGPDQTTDGASLSSWSDQSGLGLNLSEINGGGSPQNPTYQTAEINFNPVVRFTDPASTAASYFTTASNPLTTDMTLIAVFSTVQTDGGNAHWNSPAIIGADHGTTGDNYALGIDAGRVHAKIESGDSYGAQSTATFNDGRPYIATATRAVSGNTTLYIDGQSVATDASDAAVLNDPDAIGIGNHESFTTATQFAGDIAEVLLYSNDLSASDQLQVESYLAVKYGISLNANYTASNTNVIWNATTNNGYLNNITAIGQDINSGLNQKQSKSMSSNALITLGLDEIVGSNRNNNSVFATDTSFFFIGNDGGNLTLSSTGASAAVEKVGRTWKVQKTGTIDTVLIQVPASTSSAPEKLPASVEFSILVDADGDFTSGVEPTPMMLVGDNWEVEVSVSSGDFFTFGTGDAALSVSQNGDEAGLVSIEYTVTLSNVNNSGTPITFDVTDLNTGTATSGLDYTAIPGGAQISVANGASTGTYAVTVIDDGFFEAQETVDLQISNPSSSALIITSDEATGLISDDDNSEISPGGVLNDLSYWLRADTAVIPATNGSAITSWLDIGDQALDATASGTGAAPLYNNNHVNFNPSLDFSNNTDGGLTINDDNQINTGSPFSAKSYTIAFITGSDISTTQMIYEQGGNGNGMSIYISGNSLIGNIWAGASNSITTSVLANTTYVVSYVFDGASSLSSLYVNGVFAGSVATPFTELPTHGGDVGIGEVVNNTRLADNSNPGEDAGFQGAIMEIAYYNNKVYTPTERNQLESNLALKYGIGLSSNYLNSSGVTVWDSSANSMYLTNVSGIVGDVSADFNQKQSRSSNADAFITIGLGTIEAENASNTNSFSTGKDFLIWGNDNGAFTTQADNTTLLSESGDVDQLNRTWKIVESNVIDTVQLAIPITETEAAFPYSDYGNYALKIADDAGLTTNVEYVAFSSTTTNINGTDYFTCDVDFDGTRFFTIVQRGFILWTGAEWRGGLSSITDHFPSDETGDTSKTLYVLAGDTARMTEPVEVAEIDIEALAILVVESTNCLNVRNSFTNNGSLAFLADASGYAQYKGPAVQATFQQFIDNNGWHLIASPFSDATFGDFNFLYSNGFINHPVDGVSLDSCDYCNMWYYDASTDNGTDIGFGSTDAFGTWRTSTNSSQAFAPDRGWNLFLDDASGFYEAPWTLEVSGTLNNGDFSQTVNENNAGWNLVSNPYSSVINWDIIDNDLATAGIASGYHIWDEANTNYAVYAAGVGTLGTNKYIAPFQGFYVQTSVEGAQNSGNVFHTFELENEDRPNVCSEDSAAFYKVQNDRDLIRLRTTQIASGKQDEAIIILDGMADRAYNSSEDIRKLFTRYADVPSVYSKMDDDNYIINSLPFNGDKDSIRISCRVKNGSMVKIEAIDPPDGYTLFLEDIKTSIWHRIDEESYTFRHDARYHNRFWLHFSKMAISPPQPWAEEQPFYTYIEDGVLYIRTQKNLLNANWILSNVSGQVVKSGIIAEEDMQEYAIPINRLVPGAYFLMLETYEKRYSVKLLKF
jgi:hypothetical protein